MIVVQWWLNHPFPPFVRQLVVAPKRILGVAKRQLVNHMSNVGMGQVTGYSQPNMCNIVKLVINILCLPIYIYIHHTFISCTYIIYIRIFTCTVYVVCSLSKHRLYDVPHVQFGQAIYSKSKLCVEQPMCGSLVPLHLISTQSCELMLISPTHGDNINQ